MTPLERLREGWADFLAARAVAREEFEATEALGAVWCPAPHGAGGVFPHEFLMTPLFDDACPSCGAAV